MQSPFYFITRPLSGKRYNNTKEIGGIELIISTSEEDHRFSNREAEVIEVPVDYSGPIKIGDKLLVHHNVFKFYNDMKGRRKVVRASSRRTFFSLMTSSSLCITMRQVGTHMTGIVLFSQ